MAAGGGIMYGMKQQGKMSDNMVKDLRRIEATMSEACARIREREAAREARLRGRIAAKRPLARKAD